jgi:Pol polyprotein, beta-barrel domain/gag-polypeptide of LTR copia-type
MNMDITPGLEAWTLKREEAAGILLSLLTPMQYVHIKEVMDDPLEMWKRLKESHHSQAANSWYHLMQKLLSICKEDAESLSDYITCVNSATNELTALTPTTLTSKEIIEEIGTHAAISGLEHAEYGWFTSSLLLLGKLNCGTITTAFQNEDLKQQLSAASSATALADQHARRLNANRNATCTLCKRRGHQLDTCLIAHPELRLMCFREREGAEVNGQTGAVNSAQGNESSNRTPELATNASQQIRSHTTYSDTHWNTDTGATSHMTPHRHWLHNYKDHHICVHLANNEMIYSAGRGDIFFKPIMDGRSGALIKLSDILHVPVLQNNLLAVL